MHLYGFIIGISLIIGIEYFSRHQKIISTSRQSFFIIGLIVSAILGARIYHVADNWTFYSQNLILIPQTWNGGLGIYGGIFGAVIFIYLFSLIYHFPFLIILDSIAPIMPLCQSIGRLGNFVNHEIPIWWLESGLNLCLFFFLRKSNKPTAHYLIGYGLIRFITEFFRDDTWTVNQFKIAQIISIIFIITGLTLIYHERFQIHPKHS